MNPLAIIADMEGERAVRSPYSRSSRDSEFDKMEAGFLLSPIEGKNGKVEPNLELTITDVPLANGTAHSQLSLSEQNSNKVLEQGKPIKKPVKSASMEEPPSAMTTSGFGPKKPLRAVITLPPTLPARDVEIGLQHKGLTKQRSTEKEAAVLPAMHEKKEVAIFMDEQIQHGFDEVDSLVQNALSDVAAAPIPDFRAERSAKHSQAKYGMESALQRSNSQAKYDVESDIQRSHSHAEYDMELDSQTSHSQANENLEIPPVDWPAQVDYLKTSVAMDTDTELKQKIEAPPLPSGSLEPHRLSATDNSDSGRESMVFEQEANGSTVAVGIETFATQ